MLSAEEFRLFRDLIYEESGMLIKESRQDFLENRLVKRMAATSMVSPYRYYRHISSDNRAELTTLLDLLTVNETSFFRNRPQIELFQHVALPEMIKRREALRQSRLRIWSAGCSTGEEPYTIAMVVRDTLPQLRSWDIRIYASDLSLTALRHADAGVYELDKVQATVEDRHITRYFERNGNVCRIKDELRSMVIFDYHNLKNDNGLRDLDCIFCRNVMIYFDLNEQKRLAERFYESLTPGGYLLVGHAESLQSLRIPFQFVYAHRGTAYKKYLKEDAI